MRVKLRRGQICRCNTPTIRYGSVRSSVSYRTVTAQSHGSSAIGMARWPDYRSASRYPPIDHTRWRLINAERR
ncbi:Uncharacterised protein [Mycobacteroides abscessus subsp. abscessus]|nr:Uncharacterised protein [Mycobacteroides abscessus subsp. abscessus]